MLANNTNLFNSHSVVIKQIFSLKNEELDKVHIQDRQMPNLFWNNKKSNLMHITAQKMKFSVKDFLIFLLCM